MVIILCTVRNGSEIVSASCIKEPLCCRDGTIIIGGPPREVDHKLLLVPEVVDILGVWVLREHPGAVDWVPDCGLNKPEEMSRAAL